MTYTVCTMYIYIWLYLYIYLSIYHIYIYIHIDIYICTRLCVCTCVRYVHIYMQKIVLSKPELPRQRLSEFGSVHGLVHGANPDPPCCSAPLSCHRVSAGGRVNVGSDCCHFEASLGVCAKRSSGFVFPFFLCSAQRDSRPKKFSIRLLLFVVFVLFLLKAPTLCLEVGRHFCVANHLFMMSQRALIDLCLCHTPFFFNQKILILTESDKQRAKYAILLDLFCFVFVCFGNKS